jgi:hypothetical protein
VYTVLSVGKPEGKRPRGRPRRRWEDNIKMDLQEVVWGCMNWIDLTQDRDRWRIMNPSGSIKCGELLEYLVTDWLLRKDSAPQIK